MKLGCYKTNQGGAGLNKKRRLDSFPVEDILAGKYPNFQTYKLKLKLIAAGIKEDRCKECG